MLKVAVRSGGVSIASIAKRPLRSRRRSTAWNRSLVPHKERRSGSPGVPHRRWSGISNPIGRDGETLIVQFEGSTKRRRSRDIETAKRLWRDYRRRLQEGLDDCFDARLYGDCAGTALA